jgi:hypothetical protein
MYFCRHTVILEYYCSRTSSVISDGLIGPRSRYPCARGAECYSRRASSSRGVRARRSLASITSASPYFRSSFSHPVFHQNLTHSESSCEGSGMSGESFVFFAVREFSGCPGTPFRSFLQNQCLPLMNNVSFRFALSFYQSAIPFVPACRQRTASCRRTWVGWGPIRNY